MPLEARFFLQPRPVLKPTQLSVQWVLDVFLGVKQPERITRHRPTPSTGLRTCWKYTSASPPCLRGHVKGWCTKHYFID
jgi:hypothetical protein